MAKHNESPPLFPDESTATLQNAVTCLGMTFENDEKRRDYFLEKLREKLQNPEFRKIEGFPIGSDEDILSLSDPPYYTACPNPFLYDFVRTYGILYQPDEGYHREPFASDVNEGKGGKIYKAHTYHTKVPHEAIARYILHYTEPGDLILDAFAGCGMTGVAAAFCGMPDQKFKREMKKSLSAVSWGSRRAILVDLSPFAAFLTHNMNYPWTSQEFSKNALALVETVQGEMPPDVYGKPPASYLLWSQVFLCPECTAEIVFGEVGVTKEGAISSRFECPSCGAAITKSRCENKHETFFDDLLGSAVTQNKYLPVAVMRTNGGRLEPLSDSDYNALSQMQHQQLTEVPVVPMMFKGTNWGDMYRAGYHFGVSHVHHFWTKRNLAVLSEMWRKASEMRRPNQMRFLLTSFMVKTGSRMHNIGMKAGKVNLAGQIFNTLQIPSLFAERNLYELAKGKIDDIAPVFELAKQLGEAIVSTGSAATLQLPNDCIDYVFVDPPFGSNIVTVQVRQCGNLLCCDLV